MKNRTKKYSILLIVLALSTFGIISHRLYANEIDFQASAPKVVRAGEQFQLVYSLNANVDDFTPPNFGEFRYLGGPSASSSTSINMVNGKTTRTSSHTYTYYIQAPATAGKYTLGQAKALYKRKPVFSNKLQIEVVGSGTNASAAASSASNASNKASNTSSSGEDLFVRLHFNKTSAYVGEQLTAWVKIYTKVNLSGVDQQFKGPNFSGFYRQDVEIAPLSSLEREKVGDDIYSTGVIRKVILYPQKTGEVIIDPFDVLVEVQKKAQRRSQSVFDEFFGSSYQRQRINLTTKRVKLNIKPLPGNQPNDFSGAVGKFSITSSANMTEVSTNDAITFKVAVSGKGNIKLIDKLTTDFPPAFDVFEPVKKVNLDKSNQGRSGRVVFEYTAIPRHAGDFEVAPFSIWYFDIDSKTYKTISTRRYFIHVNKGKGDSTTVVSSSLSKEDIELLGSDIRYIRTNGNLRKADNFVFGKAWFFGIYIVALLVLLVMLVIRREQIKRNADKVKLRNRKAAKLTTRRLKQAQKLLKANEKIAFIDEIERALWAYLSDKLNIPVSELSKEKAQQVLSTKGLDAQLTDELFKIIDTCQYARYAPGGMESELSDLFRQTQEVFRKIDQSL